MDETSTPVSNDEVLIVQANKRKQKLNFKLRKRIQKGYVPDSYNKVLNPKDYNDLAILFEDLDFIIGAPVEKAYRKYKQNKGNDFPFF
jgi:23S rRNA-/tRNA-specific pseudouridylate synthase